MNRNILLLVFCFYLPSCVSQQTTTKPIASSSKTADITHFAKHAWDSVAKKIPTGMEESFGFRNWEEIENSSVGNPVKMYYWQDGAMIASNTFRFPILVDEKMVSLLSVFADEGLHIGDFGGSQLARYIQLISDEYEVKATGILRIHSMRTDFLIFEKNSTSYFIPVTPETLQNLSNRTILNIDDILAITQK
jgi:hypothetical protein